MVDLIPFSLFIFITLFHVYMGFGGPINTKYFFPTVQGNPLPFHSIMALPVAGLLLLSTLSFGFQVGYIQTTVLGEYNQYWLGLTCGALIFRSLFGFICFHLLNKLIDNCEFKTWDLRLYSPLCLYLGAASLLALI